MEADENLLAKGYCTKLVCEAGGTTHECQYHCCRIAYSFVIYGFVEMSTVWG